MNDVRVLPYLLLLPATAFLFAFFLVPFAQVAVEAFTAQEGLSLANFEMIARDWKFWPAMRNTLLLTALIVPIQLVLSLFMATLVTNLGRGRDIALYVFTIPLGISDLAAGLIWLALLDQSGFLNTVLFKLGLIEGPHNLLSYQNVPALFAAIILAEVWRATAIMLVIL